MNSITVSIGSNTENRAEEVSRALVWLRRFMPCSAETTPYLTPAEGEGCSGSYLNAVVRGRTTFTVAVLQSKFKAYERRRGRIPEHKAMNHIIIDIDLVEFGGTILNPDEFASPHFQKGFASLR